MRLRQWSRELDERFLSRSPKAPPPWSSDVGHLMSAKKWLELLAGGSAILGLAMLAAELFSGDTLVLVAINTLVVGPMFWGLMSSFNRPLLRRRLELSSTTGAAVPVTSPAVVAKRCLPWILLIVAAFLGLSLVSSTAPVGIVLGSALWYWGEARWIGRWEQTRGVEVLLPVKGWRKAGGFYLRPVSFSGKPVAETGSG